MNNGDKVCCTFGWSSIHTFTTAMIQDRIIPAIKENDNIGKVLGTSRHVNVFGVPNGGLFPVTFLHGASGKYKDHNGIPIFFSPVEMSGFAHIIVDDIIDSGETKRKYKDMHPNVPFFAVYDKQKNKDTRWISFPWERMSKGNDTIESNIKRILQYIGEDPDRDGLKETPKRVAKSYSELYSGYGVSVPAILKTFKNEKYDEMIVLKDIEFYSTCEHHMLPFSGKAHIAYIPNGRVVGISKLARLLEVYSRRLQIQERLTNQVTTALMDHLQCNGAACVLEASHSCMTCRGVGKQNSVMVTSSLEGVFREPPVRAEFLSLVTG